MHFLEQVTEEDCNSKAFLCTVFSSHLCLIFAFKLAIHSTSPLLTLELWTFACCSVSLCTNFQGARCSKTLLTSQGGTSSLWAHTFTFNCCPPVFPHHRQTSCTWDWHSSPSASRGMHTTTGSWPISESLVTPRSTWFPPVACSMS